VTARASISWSAWWCEVCHWNIRKTKYSGPRWCPVCERQGSGRVGPNLVTLTATPREPRP
jgi:hypothetical protein